MATDTTEDDMATFLGRWEQLERTNVEQLTKVFGIPEEKREAAQRDMMRETLHVSKEGDYWTFKFITPIGARENRFRMGEEYEIQTSFANFKGVANFEGVGQKKVVQKLKHPRTEQFVGTAINEVKGDTMHMTLKIGGVESISTFQRV